MSYLYDDDLIELGHSWYDGSRSLDPAYKRPIMLLLGCHIVKYVLYKLAPAGLGELSKLLA